MRCIAPRTRPAHTHIHLPSSLIPDAHTHARTPTIPAHRRQAVEGSISRENGFGRLEPSARACLHTRTREERDARQSTLRRDETAPVPVTVPEGAGARTRALLSQAKSGTRHPAVSTETARAHSHLGYGSSERGRLAGKHTCTRAHCRTSARHALTRAVEE